MNRKPNLDFTGQYVLVTGGTRGIGKMAARRFADNGANVIITGRNSVFPGNLEQEFEGRAQYLQGDFSNDSGIHAFTAQLEKFARIDVCINNAGINRIHPIAEIDDRDYDELLSVNINAPFKICRYLSGRMKEQRYGRIVNVASIWSVITKAGRTMYAISKNALVGLTKTLAVELAPFNITVNAISPGFTLTELTESSLTPQEMEKLAAQVPINRFATPEEIANVILFLAGRENSYMTGQNIIVDGGFTNV